MLNRPRERTLLRLNAARNSSRASDDLVLVLRARLLPNAGVFGFGAPRTKQHTERNTVGALERARAAFAPLACPVPTGANAHAFFACCWCWCWCWC